MVLGRLLGDSHCVLEHWCPWALRRKGTSETIICFSERIPSEKSVEEQGRDDWQRSLLTEMDYHPDRWGGFLPHSLLSSMSLSNDTVLPELEDFTQTKKVNQWKKSGCSSKMESALVETCLVSTPKLIIIMCFTYFQLFGLCPWINQIACSYFPRTTKDKAGTCFSSFYVPLFRNTAWFLCIYWWLQRWNLDPCHLWHEKSCALLQCC